VATGLLLALLALRLLVIGRYRCWLNTTFSAISGNFDGTLTGITIGSGNIIYGEFNSFTAGTGQVIAYKSA
jgi:hypothetical protein